jgi:glycosyltransferase involved in cell wall biosynthesis
MCSYLRDTTLDFHALEPFRKRILWLRNTTRRGVSYARNRAIERSRAEWIKFLDADDVLAPFALDVLRNTAGQMPQSIHVVTGGCHRLSDGIYHDYIAGAMESLDFILKQNPILPSATFVRREALLAVGMFDERIDFEEDWDLWLKLNEKYGADAFGVTAQPICYYWIHNKERDAKVRNATVDGLPVRHYFQKRYGIEIESK